MGQYEQVRSSSPSNERWDNARHDDLELQEQRERLLSGDGDGDGDGEKDHSRAGLVRNRSPPRIRRRSWWRLALFGLAGAAFLAIVGALLHQLYLSELRKEDVQTFRRHPSDYIIDPHWNYDSNSTVREFHWTISDITANPDGVFRPMMVINGQFPGPMIVVNEGDKVVVNVVNQAKNATAIHWHGLFQNGTNFMDGTVGTTQCPIAPGQSFRYEFQVKGQAGSYFYHGHQAAQALDGLAGPFIILSREERMYQQKHYDTDRVIMVQDWYHDASDGLLRKTLSPGSESSPTPNGALINGQNKVDCSLHPKRRCDSSTAHLPTFDVAPGKSHRLRIINVGGFAWFEVSIDKHLDLPVTEVDGVTVEAHSDSAVLVGPGQRYSVILNANRIDTGNHLYWFRARMLNHCFAENVLPDQGVSAATAILRYNGSGPGTEFTAVGQGRQPELPKTEADSGKFTVVCKDPAPGTYRPLPPRPAPEYAHHSYYLRVNLEIGNWRLERGFLNQSTFRPQLASPTLHRVVDGLAAGDDAFEVDGVNGAAFDSKHELVVSSHGVEVVDVILQNFDEGNHPFHLHGMQMYILAQGHGYFPGYEALNLRPEGKGILDPAGDESVVLNPLRRDVTTVEGFGWTLVRFVADNPGVWLFHCHMIWHAEAGMGMQFAARLDVLRGWAVPEQGRRACAAPPGELERGSTPKDDIWFGHFEDGGR